jgi:hypothetical protein
MSLIREAGKLSHHAGSNRLQQDVFARQRLPKGNSLRSRAVLTGLSLALVVSLGVPGFAQDAAAPPSPKPKPCTGPEYRQFDFWVGEWDVRGAQNKDPKKPPSHSRISIINGGCAVREEYKTPTGYEGTSLNYYDAKTRKWKQFWMDNQGQPVTQVGGMSDGSMTLNEVPDGDNRGRTTWTPLDGGNVRQLWEKSTDGGKTWKVVFDGTYTPRKGSARP